MMNEIEFDTVELIAAIKADMDADNSARINELATAIFALDGVQECDLAVAMVRADARRADEFCVTLCEALDPAQSATPAQSADTSLRIIAEIVESLLMLTPAERGTVAKELAEEDPTLADMLAMQLDRQATDVRLRRMLRGIFDVDEHDYEAQIAGAQ